MNEMSKWEMQLLSWTPRRPSPALERRLFAAGPALVAETLPPFRFGWLAPAAALVALLCVLFSQRYLTTLAPSTAASPMVAMILSNQSAAAYLPGRFQAQQNNVPARAFCLASNRTAAAGAALLPHSELTNRP
jgi:hypothetical protein